MLKHFAGCLGREDKATDAVLVLAEGRGLFGTYWLYAGVKADAKLDALDKLLRAAWLECCGHLSKFHGVGKSALARDLPVGASFGYDYDFGSTTSLRLKVVASERVVFRGRESARLLGLNLPLSSKCASCGEPATLVCAECAWGGEPLSCETCGPDHGCGEEMLLPLVNSPRTGVCGYTGDDWSSWARQGRSLRSQESKERHRDPLASFPHTGRTSAR